jgi:S1-C subfamily serine protease
MANKLSAGGLRDIDRRIALKSRVLVIALIVTMLTAGAAILIALRKGSKANIDIDATVSHVRTSVVRILASSKTGAREIGTGFFVSADGYIVTARHVIALPEAVGTSIVFETDGRTFSSKAKFIEEEREFDFALLLAEDNPGPCRSPQ